MADGGSYTRLPGADPDGEAAPSRGAAAEAHVQIVNEHVGEEVHAASTSMYPPRIRHCSSEGNLTSRTFVNKLPEHATPLLLTKHGENSGHVLLANSAGSFRWLHHAYPSIGEQIRMRQEFSQQHPFLPHYPIPIYKVRSNIGSGALVGGSQAIYSSTHWDNRSNLSKSTSGFFPFCRICHMTGSERDRLISPCRCAGSMQFIHYNCLQKWIEICSKKSRRSPKCELCHYQYTRHKKFKFREWHFPHVTCQDKWLHGIFIVMLILMIACAIATVSCFISDRDQAGRSRSKQSGGKADLTTEEIITLACGVLFFISFFVAMTVQIKARHTIYQLFVKLILHNLEYEIDPYDRSKDALYAETNDEQATHCRFLGNTCV